jgi:hypothetical protein
MSPHPGLALLRTAFALVCLTVSGSATGPPTAVLDNGLVHLSLYLPNAATGFYRGTRFDWSGIISGLTFAGHTYYGPWFTRVDAAVRNFVFDGPDIVAGTASAITGPADEFLTADNAALGFNEAAPGATFVKIGVGVLRRPDGQKYSTFRDYDLVDSGKWTVGVHRTSIEFTQRVIDPGSGYGYRYTKTIRLIPGQPSLLIEHTLTNLGRLPIETNVYNHNFLVLDHQLTGPDFIVTLPFQPSPERPYKTDLGGIEGNRLVYRRLLADRDVFSIHLAGFGPTAADYDIRVDNARAGAGMHIQGDHPLEMEELWSIRSVVAMEPFVKLEAAPGKTIRWSQSYTYYTIQTHG